MSYVRPRVQIEQEFTQQPIFTERPLPALILGPQYELHRYAEPTEKAGISVGAYNPSADQQYPYPSRATGSTVDQSYVKVFLDQAYGVYLDEDDDITIPTGHTNRLASALVFRTANGSNRSAVFDDRDVQVGDVAIVEADGTTQVTKVVGFVASKTPASVGTPTAVSVVGDQTEDLDNAPVYTGPGSAPLNLTISNATTAYVGYLNKGVFQDTYIAEVTTGGTISSGNVRFRVTSANGVFPPVENVAIGGGEVVLDASTGQDVALSVSGAGTFVVGNKWEVTVTAESDAYTPVAAGTYTGSSDATYTVVVTRGGPFFNGSNAATCAQVTVYSTITDGGSSINVADGVPFALGSFGATFQVPSGANGDRGLFLGDTFSVVVTSEKDANVSTLVLKDSLDPVILANSGDIRLRLAVVKNGFKVPKVRDAVTETYNWETDANNITINAGIYVTESGLYEGGNPVVPRELPVYSAIVYVEHRDLLSLNTTTIRSVSDASAVQSVLGLVTPDNPIAQAVYNAALNSSGVPVYYLAVASDDLAGYNAALDLVRISKVVYGIVPTTYDSAVQSAVIAHVDAMSTPDRARWRVTWLSKPFVSSALLLDVQEDNNSWTATVSDDPLTSGTQYTRVQASQGTAGFLTKGVRAGDKLLINFRLGSQGQEVYDTYTIDQVRSETELVLVSPGLPNAIGSPVKFKIERNYTVQEQVDAMVGVLNGIKNRRVRVVLPDTFVAGGVKQPGYLLAAAMAGLRAGVVPQAGLTNSAVVGVDDVSQTYQTFTETQLDQLAEAGAWLVVQDTFGSTPYVRHQLTTDNRSLNAYEDSITTNVDSISYGLQGVLDPFIGRYNRNPETISLIRFAIEKELKQRVTDTAVFPSGPQLISFRVLRVAASTVFQDRVEVDIELEVPYPINTIRVKLVV
jgi:hypothetical protein